jgi:hypothetical protein
MNQRSRVELAVFLGLVALGATLRVQLRELPNFAPVAAVALFSGYFFRSRAAALAVPLSIMLISDAFIGSYDLRMMAVVYAALASPVLVRGLLRRWLSFEERPVVACAGLLTCGLGASLFFFVVTNFATWIFFGTYEHTLVGLMHCFTQAIPFFRYTLTGDLLFATVLFGGYAFATYAARATSSESTAIVE